MWKMQINLDSQNLLTFGSFFYSQEYAVYYVQETSVVAGNGGVKGRKVVLSK